MPSKTNLELKNALKSLWGYEEGDSLSAQDEADLQTYVNQALFECFAPVDGTRPNYGEQEWSAILKAPVVATLGVTQGSKTVTGYAFESAYAGSFVKIGERMYRYGGSSGGVHSLAQPWQDATGSVTATIYHNAVALPGLLIETATKHPEILGLGLLSPLPDADQELLLRAGPAYDFRALSGDALTPRLNVRRHQFNQSLYLDEGDPVYYHVASASMGATFGIGNRLHVYPLPDKLFTVSMPANYIPSEGLSADGDIPPMPFNAVDNILLPIAREKLAENTAGRRFTGNVQLIMAAAQRARIHLKSLTKPQRHTGGGFRVSAGW